MWNIYLKAFFVSFSLAWLAVRALDPLARRIGLLDHPRGRKDHALPTPVTGGVAVMLGVFGTLPLLMPLSNAMIGFCLGAGLLLVVGVLDDLHDLPWLPRIAAQCTAALILVHVGGVRADHVGPLIGSTSIGLGSFSVPFTVFITVGIINAVNMADGADGLAGSLTLVALVMLAAASLVAGNQHLFAHIVPLIGAVAGFLMLNMRHPWQPRARAFLGNSGSAIIGFTLAWLAIHVSHSPGHPVSSILGPWLLAPPLIDCIVLITRRLREGRSPFSADRGHMHHLLLDAGFPPSQVALGLAGLSLLLGSLASCALYLGVPPSLLVFAFLGLIGAYHVFTLDRARAVRTLAGLRARIPRSASEKLPAIE